KIAILDPTIGGTGQAGAIFLYATEGLGKDYLRQLFGQGLIVSRDDRQIVDWIVRGTYPLEVSGSQTVAAQMEGQGVHVPMLGAENMREGGWTSAGSSAVAAINRAPHPNAIKVYLDYLLSKDGSTAFARSVGYISRRTDVPIEHVPDVFIPKKGINYLPSYKEKYVRLRDEMVAFLKPLMPA
ncbi:MAG TPA: hypothetical protein VKU60_11255, partial [Chloroflexota bacterium]|nr:hypothetical protein [Chloroflexota bacterium]